MFVFHGIEQVLVPGHIRKQSDQRQPEEIGCMVRI